jgi:hypothetical protein
MENKNSAADLRAKCDDRIKRLAQLTSEATRSEEMFAFLKTCAKFHHYSFNNQFLIMLANPNATQVAGYKCWLSLNRYVRKGEHGIPILAPIVIKTKLDGSDKETRQLVGFKIAHVFDISQTEGEPLATIEWTSPAKLAELEGALLAFCKIKGINVVIEELHGSAQGMSSGGSISLAPGAGTKTLIHEIAHELMHRNGDKTDKHTRELEAEAVAFVVGEHFGLRDAASPNYLALWDADAEKLAKRAHRIQQTAVEIISAVEGKEGEE